MSTVAKIHDEMKMLEEQMYNLHIKLQVAQQMPVRDDRTKMKWISDSETETYRVAIVTKKGILQVKAVDHAAIERHLTSINGGPEYYAMTKRFFENEMAWLESLPEGGQITVTPPPLTKKALKKLCLEPLAATTDALKLKEVEERFPGAIIALRKGTGKIVIQYMNLSGFHCIFSRQTDEVYKDFSEFGVPDMVFTAEWRDLYIDLTDLVSR